MTRIHTRERKQNGTMKRLSLTFHLSHLLHSLIIGRDSTTHHFLRPISITIPHVDNVAIEQSIIKY